MTEPGKGKKDRWDIIRALGPAIIAAVVGVLGLWYNYNQADITKRSDRRQVYTNIMAQREVSDNSIRATMFATLLKAMFNDGDGLGTKDKGASDDIDIIKQRVMFLDLMSRNFDTIDIKPLFTELDRDLTKKLADTRFSVQQNDNFFAMRDQLRRIGRHLSIKQLNALASLSGSEVTKLVIYTYADGVLHVTQDKSNGNDTSLPVEVKPRAIVDGMVDISLEYNKSKESDPSSLNQSFILTFYDMPYIDNMVIDKDMRISVVLSKYLTTADLDRFKGRFKGSIGRSILEEYEELKKAHISQYAELRIIKFPSKYIGNRDRPYLQDIMENLIENNEKVKSGKTGPAK